MKKQIQKLALFTSLLIISFFTAHADSMTNATPELVMAWHPPLTNVRIPSEIIGHSSALPIEVSQTFYLQQVAIVHPEEVVASGRGRLIELSEEEYSLIGDRLRELLGPKLVPEEAVAHMGVYERKVGEKMARMFQLSYQRGSLRVGIGGKMDGFKPDGFTVLLAQADEAPRAENYIHLTPEIDVYSGWDIVDSQDEKEVRLKTTLLSFK